MDALKEQLGNRRHMANAEFSAVETQNIIKYLNDQFRGVIPILPSAQSIAA